MFPRMQATNTAPTGGIGSMPLILSHLGEHVNSPKMLSLPDNQGTQAVLIMG